MLAAEHSWRDGQANVLFLKGAEEDGRMQPWGFVSQKASSETYKDGRGLVGVKQLFWWRDVADKPISSRPCADVAL